MMKQKESNTVEFFFAAINRGWGMFEVCVRERRGV